MGADEEYLRTGGVVRTMRGLMEKRRRRGLARKLTSTRGSDNQVLVDFCSNDYLSFASSATLSQDICTELKEVDGLGSTGSRLLTGNNEYAEALERTLAAFHHGEAALLFNSGYDLNLGLFSCIAQKGDTIVFDDLVHASVRDGMRLGRGQAVGFKHNNLVDLERQFCRIRSEKGTAGSIIVAVETVYSMEGDIAPLKEIVSLCVKYRAHLVVDEAHSTGLYGESGRGVLNELGLEQSQCMLIRVHTFGKGMGCHGAVAICSQLAKDYLLNYARPLIYSTSLPYHSLVTINQAYRYLQRHQRHIREQLFAVIAAFQREARACGIPKQHLLLNPNTPVQGIIVPGNAQVVAASQLLRTEGFDVRAIRSPTVPAGSERLRVVLHAHNTPAQVASLLHHTVRALHTLACDGRATVLTPDLSSGRPFLTAKPKL